MDKQYWASRYEEKKVGWQLENVHPKLLRYIKMLTKDETPKKFFLPLCGKSKDIPYLLSLGHTVFGIEYVAQAIEEFAEENSIRLKLNEEGSCYESTDGKLVIYCGDYKHCPVENWGPFDIVWDRSSIIALGYEKGVRESYVEIIKRSVGLNSQKGHQFCYLLQTVEYDKTTFEGPPKCVSEEDVKNFFDSWCSIKLLEKKYIPEDSIYRTVSGKMTGDAYESYLLLTNKT